MIPRRQQSGQWICFATVSNMQYTTASLIDLPLRQGSATSGLPSPSIRPATPLPPDVFSTFIYMFVFRIK